MSAHPEIAAFWQGVPPAVEQVLALLSKRYGGDVRLSLSQTGQGGTAVFLHAFGQCVQGSTLDEAIAELEKRRPGDAKTQAAKLRDAAAALIDNAKDKIAKAEALEAGT